MLTEQQFGGLAHRVAVHRPEYPADAACLDWFMWAGGAWRPNYELNLEPIDGKDRSQIELIRSRM